MNRIREYIAKLYEWKINKRNMAKHMKNQIE